MKRISNELFDELKKTSAFLAVGFLLTRTDGKTLGFTSSDMTFVYDGITYRPTNAFSGSAAVSKNNFSVDNMNAVSIFTDEISADDLKGGLWDNAQVKVFWIRPDKPEWGIVPIRGGRLGEIKLKQNTFETELRALSQLLQQSQGKVFTLECSATFGDSDCGMPVDPDVWSASSPAYVANSYLKPYGTVVAPSTPNGFWYECVGGNKSEKLADLMADYDLAANTDGVFTQEQILYFVLAKGING